MPFTPFHLGPALLFGLAFSSIFDLPTLLIASVIPDVEPFCILLFNLSGEPHSFFHSYLGSSILAVLVTVIVYPLRDLLNRIMVVFRISQKSSFKKILFASFIGVYSHVFLDSFLYSEMKPLYPLQGNPFVDIIPTYIADGVIYGFCGISFIFGVTLYLYKIRKGTVVLG
ncbi:MAG: metal-dependent hydrolase [Candidatus Bathyarchaeia archaeon]|nr:metal-dependent hydrolase [Candidatus Bathyarchaeia archaeon]